MPGRHCTTCGKRHPINGRRCKECGAIFRVTEVWEAAIGQPASREQVLAMNEHPKFEELCRFDIRRLIASAPAARAGDQLDIDAWVAASVHQALTGPTRESDPDFAKRAYSEASAARALPGGTRAEPPRDHRLALALTVSLIAAFAVVIWVNSSSGGSSPAPSNGRNAAVERNGDGRTDDEIISQVRHDFCGQGYDSFELKIVRTQVSNAGGVTLQAGVSTFVQKC